MPLKLLTTLAALLLGATAMAAEPASPAPDRPAVSAQPEAAAPGTTPVAPPSVSAPPVKDAAKVEPKKDDKQDLFKPGVMLQGWYFLDRTVPGGCTSSDCIKYNTSFRLRRSELHLGGELASKKLAYKVMIDPARVLDSKEDEIKLPNSNGSIKVRQPQNTSTGVLQDVVLTFKTGPVDISAGQFKIPVSLEGYGSSSKLLLPERATSSRAFGDRRDIGLRAEKKYKKFGYAVGLFNGTGQNTLDNNNALDVAIRLEAYPVEGLTLAAVSYDSVGQRLQVGTKDRWEGDVRYVAGPLLVQAEFIRARDRDSKGVAHGYGTYGAVAFSVTDALQPVARVGRFDPLLGRDAPASAARDEETSVEAGLNYYLLKQDVKVQLAFGRFFFDSKPAQNLAILATQMAF